MKKMKKDITSAIRLLAALTALFFFMPYFSQGIAAPKDASGSWREKILAAGTSGQTTLSILETGIPGPSVFVVGGVHGDEIAGWIAALVLRDTAALSRGSLYILSPANAWGAVHGKRVTGDGWDLNRIFPGKTNAQGGQGLAYEIFEEIRLAQPSLVLDLHEALPREKNRDYLGSSLIFTSMDGIEGLIFGALEDTAQGKLCTEPFDVFTGAPVGSLNESVTNRLGIPVLTVETPRAHPLLERIQDHLSLVRYVFKFYEMD